jgi:DNA modification methylase
MTHQSEDAIKLKVKTINLSRLDDMPTPNAFMPEVWFFILPYGRSLADADISDKWYKQMTYFAEGLHNDSVMAFLTTPEDAAETWAYLDGVMQYQLLISVKLAEPIALNKFQLPVNHAEILVMSKYKASLKHTKTRIAYSFCPACDKTTKDYGGKKHLYHAFGTLISDVWRDISYTPGLVPKEIINRLADLFGLEPYRDLKVVDLSLVSELNPTKRTVVRESGATTDSNSVLHSSLIVGDSIMELKKIPDNSIDFCFADPPYNLAKRYDSWDDSLHEQEYFNWCDNWLDELARVLKPGRTIAVLNIPRFAIRYFEHLKTKLVFQNWITWDALSLPVRNIMPANYSIICFSKGQPRPLPGLVNHKQSRIEDNVLTIQSENFCLRASCIKSRLKRGINDREPLTDLWWDCYRLKHNSRRVDHPCQLPPQLMRRLIALYTSEGEVVLDPFNGAGTTTLCAAQMGRKYVGIELSEEYHKLAMERHVKLSNGEDPFGKSNSVPVVKNSSVKRIANRKYEVPKKTLQLEVKRVAEKLGHLPSRDELQKFSQYPIRLYDEYFVSWSEVCAAAKTTGMSELRTTAEALLIESE